MTIHNKILPEYFKKIAWYFTYDWIFLSVLIIMAGYFLINYFFNNSFILFNFARMQAFIMAIIILTIFIIKYFISSKIRKRLIVDIVDDSRYYVLTIYDKSVIKVDKALIPLERQKADYFINDLFSNKTGTIHDLYNKQSERFIVKIDNKKYYLVPPLFENEVFI